MSKKQTPIEELEKELKSRGIYLPSIFKKAKQKEQEYTQAKVLEALERVEKENEYVRLTSERGRTSIDEDYYNGMKWAHDRIKNIIETEVKPKYE